MKRVLPSLVALTCALACGCQRVTVTGGTPKKPVATTPAGLAPTNPALLTSDAASLTGKVKLISDHGGELVSNNGSNLISDNGGGIISNNTGNIISNNGGAIVSNNAGGLIANNGGGYRLLAAPKPGAFYLSDAVVALTDATGKAVTDAKGRPLTATTDASGSYRFTSPLPAGNLVLHVKLGTKNGLPGGELTAMLPHQDTASVSQSIDTATSLGAAYVLGKFVNQSQATYDKLPASEAARLSAVIAEAGKLVTSAPAYQPDALIALAEKLRTQAPPVGAQLDVIKALLLGQGAGDGRPATTVALFRPTGLAVTPQGDMLIGEHIFGRIRSVSPSGAISTFADVIRGVVKQDFPSLHDLAAGPDGTVYVTASGSAFAIAPDHTIKTLIGGSGLSTEGQDDLYGLAVGSDNALYVGKSADSTGPTQVVKIKDGVTTQVALPAGLLGAPLAIAVAPDGGLYLYLNGATGLDAVVRVKDGVATTIADDFQSQNSYSGLLVTPDGTLYASTVGKVWAFTPDGQKHVAAGAGGPANTQALVVPASLARRADGTLLIEDSAAGLVYALAPDGGFKAVAGTTSAEANSAGGLSDLAISAPSSVAFDASGAMIVSERGNFQLARFDGTHFTTFAGSTAGYSGDGGPASAAHFGGPDGLAYQDGNLLVADNKSGRLRAIAPDGTVSTLLGGGPDRPAPKAPIAASALSFEGSNLAVSPAGEVYWSDNHSEICRWGKDGQIYRLTGQADKDAIDFGAPGVGSAPRPASEVNVPSARGLAFGPDGDLYVSALASLQVMRIHDPGGPSPTIVPVVGLALGAVLQQVEQFTQAQNSDAAAGVSLAMPSGLAFDPQGNMYVGEIGTLGVQLLTVLTNEQNPFGAGGGLPPVYARIRKITPDGHVTTIAGPGTRFFADPTAEDALVLPTCLSVRKDGALVIVDSGANLVRILPPGSF